MEDNQIITQLVTNLAEVATRNTASVIANKIKAIKAKQKDKETIDELEEIISDLISDKAEIYRIAQSYEQELVSQRITENDIKYITNNILPILSNFIPEGKQTNFNQIKSLLSVETLTIMQLIGFNYRKAIGEPLTNLLKSIIEAKMPVNAETNLKYSSELLEISKDKESTDRFMKLMNINK